MSPEGPFDDNIEDVTALLRQAQATIAARYEQRIHEEYTNSEQFAALCQSWAESHDHPASPPESEKTFDIAARKRVFLRLARILCYERLRRQPDTADSFESLSEYSPETLGEQLRTAFDELLAADGKQTPYRSHSEFLQAIPETAGEQWQRVIERVEQAPLTAIGWQTLGSLYEHSIPTAAREADGQFYTPGPVAELLTRWAIQSSDDAVLDPCSGSGALSRAAARRLADLGGGGQITAVDINDLPSWLTAVNLLGSDIDEWTVYHADFFGLAPERIVDDRRVGERSADSQPIGTFDATVANPPYVRQEQFAGNRAQYREHLDAFGSEYTDGPKAIDRRSDLYCYFLTHATRFLDDGGRLAWIIPTKWLVADYGPSIQQFLFDHYQLDAVVGSRNRVFEDALVDTVLLFARRCEDPKQRAATTTSFVRVDEQQSTDALLSIIERTHEIPQTQSTTIHSQSSHRTIAVRQADLAEKVGQKLSRYLTAPSLYTTLIEHADTTSLGELATITRGVKTGANPIFLLDEATVDSHGIEQRFCRPALKSIRAVDGFEQTAADAERWLLDLGEYVSTVDMEEEPTGERVSAALRRDGYTGVLSYLDWAEKQSARRNRSLAAYEPWFNLGDLDSQTAPILCPQAMDTRRLFLQTDGEVVPSNRFLCIQPEVDPTVLCGLLNATLSQIVIECHGRTTGGGAVNLSGSDLEQFCVVDPAALSATQEATIRTGFERLASGDEAGRDQIDEALVNALDLAVSVEKLQTLSEALKRRRRLDGTDCDAPRPAAIERSIELSVD